MNLKNKFPFINLFLLIIVSLFLASCSDSPTEYGLDIINGQRLLLTQLNIPTEIAPVSYRQILKLGEANYLLLGNAMGQKSSVMMKFDVINSDLVENGLKGDTLKVISAKIKLARTYKIGNDTSQPFIATSIRGYEIKTDWDYKNVKTDSLPEMNSINRLISSQVGDTCTFAIDTALAAQWLKSVTAIDTMKFKNYGIFLDPYEATNIIVGFQAFSTLGYYPKLEVTLRSTKSPSYDTTFTFNSYADAHVISLESYIKPDQGTFIVQSGVSMSSRIFIDTKSLPTDIVINKAKLMIKRNASQCRIGSSAYNVLSCYFISSMVNDTSTTINNLYSSVLYPDGDTAYTGDITDIINKQIFDNNNLGLVITSAYPYEGMEKFVLKGVNSLSPADKPQLIITYTTKKGSNAK